MKHRNPVLLTLLAATVLAASPALGLDAVEVAPAKGGVRLVVNGRLITLFRTPNGGLSPEERAKLAAGRLEDLLPDGLAPEDIEARQRGEGWGVYARGGLLMIATPEEAKLRHEEPEVTARRWAANLKAALGGAGETATQVAKALGSTLRAKSKAAKGKRVKRPVRAAKATRAPTLGVTDFSVAVPVGETRTVGLKGTAQGPINVSGSNEFAAGKPVPGKGAIEVRGLVAGKATLWVERQGKSVAFDVWVKKHAGRVREASAAQVTGTEVPSSLVRKMAAEHILDGIEREPGAVVRVAGPPQGARALSRGESTEVRYPVTISGEGFFTVKTEATVRVKNVSLPAQETRTLLYSNNPESVRELGMLFEGAVEKEGTARLFYHHQNRMGRPFLFQIHLVNPNDEPAEVQLITADAGPILNTIQVGHRAAALYLAAEQSDLGVIATIPARGSRVLLSTELPNNLTVSGIYNLRTLSGGPLVLQVRAADELVKPRAETDRLAIARCEPDVYPTPEKDEQHTYSVGDNWTFIPIGRKAISSGDRKLLGNYGVMYNLNLQLKNPTDEVKTVRVMMAAEAGWARGAFLIDGKLVESPHLAPPAEAVLHTVTLQPQEQRVVKIQTIPAGGGFYPISLVVRP
jgi:hypothetical protein